MTWIRFWDMADLRMGGEPAMVPGRWAGFNIDVLASALELLDEVACHLGIGGVRRQLQEVGQV